MFQINAVLLNLFIKESWKKAWQFPQKYYAAQFVNIDNKNCYLIQISKLIILIIIAFLKNHVTLKTGVTAAENSVLPSQE